MTPDNGHTDILEAKMEAPEHLRPETRKWFEGVCKEFLLEPHHVRLLTLAAQSWDRGEAAREVIDKDGLTFVDRFGQPKPRPEIAIERDSRIGFARMLRELQLDVAPPTQTRVPRL